MNAGGAFTGFRAPEIAEDPAGDILDVDGPLPQIGIRDAPERFDVALGDFKIEPVHRAFLHFQQSQDLIQDRGVFQNQKMGIKNTGMFGSQGRLDFLLEGADLLPGAGQGLVKPGLFLRNHASRDGPRLRFLKVGGPQVGGGANNARRHPGALQAFFNWLVGF
ncbi:MAG: hypothetical protein R3F31_19380 [Verrucomicrobiales bacterium]